MKQRLLNSTIALGISVGAAVIAVLVSMLVIALSGADAARALQALFDGAFGSRAQVAGTLSKMIPLILVGLGWIVAFSARRINIGFEGQILAGGIVATTLAILVSGLPAPFHLGLAVVGGALAGGVWAGLAAWLWARRGVNEIISTLMLNFVAIQIVTWLVRGPLQEPTGTFPRSARIVETARWPRLLENTPLAWDLLLAFALVFGISFLLARTTFGFRVRLTGTNEDAARHAGISTVRVTVAALLLSGALAGLAGSSLILGGESASMSDNFSSGFGFEGIVVALLARNAPVGVLPAALLFASLREGGGLMEARVGVSSALVLITQGVVILLVAGASFLLERRKAVRVDTGRRRGHPQTGVGTEDQQWDRSM